MSPVALLLLVIGAAAIYHIAKFSYNMFRSGKIEDEAAERKRLKEEADQAAAIEAQYPAASAKTDESNIKGFTNRT